MAEGKIIAISISEKKGQKKHNIESANLIVDYGMEAMHTQVIGIVKLVCSALKVLSICVIKGPM